MRDDVQHLRKVTVIDLDASKEGIKRVYIALVTTEQWSHENFLTLEMPKNTHDLFKGKKNLALIIPELGIKGDIYSVESTYEMGTPSRYPFYSIYSFNVRLKDTGKVTDKTGDTVFMHFFNKIFKVFL